MEPKELVKAWVDAFNNRDVEALSAMYAQDAVNHQAPESPIRGRDAIRRYRGIRGYLPGISGRKRIRAIIAANTT